jgi:hypothetical protein
MVQHSLLPEARVQVETLTPKLEQEHISKINLMVIRIS